MPLKRKKRAPTLAKLKSKAWKLLSECIRREALGSGTLVRCYTCNEARPWQEMQAGHAIPGRTGAVLLDEEVIRPQDAKCNIWGRGQYHIFAAKLIREKAESRPMRDGYADFDSAHLWWEAKLQASRQVRKWQRSELEEKITSYQARLSQLGS